MFAVENENRLLGVRQMVHRLETRIVTARARKCFGAVFLYENFKIKKNEKRVQRDFLARAGMRNMFFVYSLKPQYTRVIRKYVPYFEPE